MTKVQWLHLSEQDREAFSIAQAFLRDRLEEKSTLHWAIGLKSEDAIKRMAILDLVGGPVAPPISEPWRSAWRLIEESWNSLSVELSSASAAHRAKSRLANGERSGSLIRAIVDLVEPRLEIKPFDVLHLRFTSPPQRARKTSHLFAADLVKGEIIKLKLDNINEPEFLRSIAHALDGTILNGIDTALRIGWDGLRGLGQMSHVSNPPDDPDQFARGLVSGLIPSVKLLHAVISRLVEVDVNVATESVRRWRVTDSEIHRRLWASISCDARVAPAREVGDVLLALKDNAFWDTYQFPEIAELRAKRFIELDPHQQALLTARIARRPPRKLVPKMDDSSRMDLTRTRWAIRELRRIEIAGGVLQGHPKTWLNSRIGDFPELHQMDRVDVGPPDSGGVHVIPPNPDGRYNLLQGLERLNALEQALGSGNDGWHDNPTSRAEDWLEHPGNAVKLIDDFESVPDGAAAFGKIWGWFDWMHMPGAAEGEDKANRDPLRECARVVALFGRFPKATLLRSVDDMSHWLSRWKSQVAEHPDALGLWLRLWPVAVEATNAKQPAEEQLDLNVPIADQDSAESITAGTFNSPVGKLVEVFLATCPTVRTGDHPFDIDGKHRTMRDAMGAAATGRSRSAFIVRYQMIAYLEYFLRADQRWTEEHLIAPLLGDDAHEVLLWNAVALKVRSMEALTFIGHKMAERAGDMRLGRTARHALIRNLVFECLWAFDEKRPPAIEHNRVTQMIRSISDEDRVLAADSVLRFVRDKSA